MASSVHKYSQNNDSIICQRKRKRKRKCKKKVKQNSKTFKKAENIEKCK